jgi:hypothetical protein
VKLEGSSQWSSMGRCGHFGSDPTLHVTIAKAITEEELGRHQAEVSARLWPLLPLSFHVHTLSIEKEGTDGNWQVSSTVELI